MFKKTALTAIAFAALISTSSMASAQPGLSNLANVAPAATEQAGGIVKAGFRRRGFKFRFRRHHYWRPHFAHYGKGCYRYLRRYHRTGNYYWKKKFYWCRHY